MRIIKIFATLHNSMILRLYTRGRLHMPEEHKRGLFTETEKGKVEVRGRRGHRRRFLL